MKQVKMLILVALAVALVTFAGCSSSKSDGAVTPAGSSQSMTQDENSGHLTGTIGEIKDFMFVVTDQDGKNQIRIYQVKIHSFLLQGPFR